MTVWKGSSVWASGDSTTKGQWVEVRELGEDMLFLDKQNFAGAVMTVEEARALGSHIMNLATRVAARNGL